MKRQKYAVTISEENWGLLAGGNVAYAMNSGVTKSEALVRDIARYRGVTYHGDTPKRVGDTYTRVWRSEGLDPITATVSKVNT